MKREYEIVLTVTVDFTNVRDLGREGVEMDFDVLMPTENEIKDALYAQCEDIMRDDALEYAEDF